MTKRDRQEPKADAPRERISRLSAAILRISASLDVETVLRKVVESARGLTGARYGVIATIDEAGRPQEHVISGFAAAEARQVATWPDPMELQVKEVTVCDTPCNGAENELPKPRCYVVCRNPDQARKDATTRAKILAALENKLRSDGPKSVVANKGYKRYLKAEKDAIVVDFDSAWTSRRPQTRPGSARR